MTDKECKDTQGGFDRAMTKASRGLFGNDLNSFEAEFEWKTLYAPSVPKKDKIEWKKIKTFDALLKTQFFVDLMTKGPLMIEKIYFRSTDPERSYVVHHELVKAMKSSFGLFQGINPSFAENIVIDIVIDEAESKSFIEAMEIALKLFNIRPLEITFLRTSKKMPGLNTQRLKEIFLDMFSQKFEIDSGQLKGGFVAGFSAFDFKEGEAYSLEGMVYDGSKGRFAKIRTGHTEGGILLITKTDPGDARIVTRTESIVSIDQAFWKEIEAYFFPMNTTTDSGGDPKDAEREALPREYAERAREQENFEKDEKERRELEEKQRVQALYGPTAFPGDMRDISELESKREEESGCALL